MGTVGTGVYQKLYAVMKDIGYIQKDKKVESPGANYKYASEAAIKEKVHAALVEHRLLFIPYNSDIEERAQRDSKDKYGNDKTTHLITLKLFFRFVDIDTGESVEGALHGMGADSSEKGVFKAITGALKYIFTGTFVIPTGDDPEKEELSKEEKQQVKDESRQQQQQIAQRKIAEQQAGTAVSNWDWRIAWPRFEELLDRYGVDAVSREIDNAGMGRIEETKTREQALKLYETVRTALAKASTPTPTEPPTWVDAPHQAIKEASPLTSMLERASNIEKRLAIFKNLRLDLVEALGEKEADLTYRMVLAKHGAQPAADGQVHANGIAKDPGKSKAAITELYELTKPQAVNA